MAQIILQSTHMKGQLISTDCFSIFGAIATNSLWADRAMKHDLKDSFYCCCSNIQKQG
jgi:hypothetical protein